VRCGSLSDANLVLYFRNTSSSSSESVIYIYTRMWANAQRDGRPAEYRWRPLFNAAKFGWRPRLECRAVTLPRCETRWNLQGCPKLTKRSQPLVSRSSPYSGDMWRRYCCLTSFFLIVDTCLSCEDIARQSCEMVPRWRLFGDFLWPPYVIGGPLYFCPVVSFYLSSIYLFFPRLISAATDRMSTILLHMAWP